jgi:hypothetical protein
VQLSAAYILLTFDAAFVSIPSTFDDGVVDDKDGETTFTLEETLVLCRGVTALTCLVIVDE